MGDRVRLKADIELEIPGGREVERACDAVRHALDALRLTGDAGTDPTTVIVADRSRPKPRARRWNNTYRSRDEADDD